MSFIPVILAGGSGTRLWPMSRKAFPKQFLSFDDSGKSFLQQTISRLMGLDHQPPIVICNEAHRFLVAEQLQQIGCKRAKILLEPCGRNTAPAIALAALILQEKSIADPMLVLSADHVIHDKEKFHEAVIKTLEVNDSLITFGVKPTYPEVGYGYIHATQALEGYDNIFQVNSFVEKPDFDTAQSYIDSGEYYWNSGMFMFTADMYLQELRLFAEDIYDACVAACNKMTKDLDFVRIDSDSFELVRDESIDYAVMEKSSNVKMVRFDGSWSDIGSWKSLAENSKMDSNNNALVGDVLAIDTANSYVHANDKLIAVVGLSDLVVVDSDNALLVMHKNHSQKVKDVVNILKSEGRDESHIHRQVYRPWGHYDSISGGERYQVKKIVVKPNEKLSVQMHHHRAEHWIVVSGTAKVSLGDETFLVHENQSTYIPIGEVHALENPGKLPLVLIEVQSGSYLGEDDIVRFEDRYGRAKSSK